MRIICCNRCNFLNDTACVVIFIISDDLILVLKFIIREHLDARTASRTNSTITKRVATGVCEDGAEL